MISTFKRNQHFKKVLVNKAFTHAQEQKKAMPLRHSAYILFSVRLRPLYKQINNYSYVRTIPTKWKKWAYNQFPYLLSSYLRIAIFKKGACRLSHVVSTSYLQATPRLWNLHRQNRGKRACFQQISNCVTYWNAQTKRELESG